MAKRKAPKKSPGKKPAKRSSVSPVERLQAALVGRTTEELVGVIVKIARSDSRILRQLQNDFGVHDSMDADELVAVTHMAIADATDFDEREMNYNFDYDHDAYETVLRNFKRLVKSDSLSDAMQLALELMKQGSYQIEMSDEGMMTDEIKDCLTVVITAVGKSTLPAATICEWCDAMIAKDRVGFLCDEELTALKKKQARRQTE